MDLTSHKEIIRKDVEVINKLGLTPVQVYILCKASMNDMFQLNYHNFMRYLDAFRGIECEPEDKIDLMDHLISLNTGKFDDVVQNLIRLKGLDPKSVSNILKKEFLRPTYEYGRREIQREIPGANQIANSSQGSLSPSEIAKVERNIRMTSLGLDKDVITQGGPENALISTFKEYPSLSSSQAQAIEDEQLTDRQHPTSSPVFDQKLRNQSLKHLTCIFCNHNITNSQDHATFSRCNHNLHRVCLINALSYVLNRGSVEMRCICEDEIEETDLIKYLPASDHQRLESCRLGKIIEEEQSKMKAEIYFKCMRCGLNVGINKSDSYGQCLCGAKYCSECFQEFNPEHKCLGKKPEPICDHRGTHLKSAGVGLIACGKCKAILCSKCYKSMSTCACPKKRY